MVRWPLWVYQWLGLRRNALEFVRAECPTVEPEPWSLRDQALHRSLLASLKRHAAAATSSNAGSSSSSGSDCESAEAWLDELAAQAHEACKFDLEALSLGRFERTQNRRLRG